LINRKHPTLLMSSEYLRLTISTLEIMETRENELLSLDLFFEICILNAAIFFAYIFSSAISIGNTLHLSIDLLEANLSLLISHLLLSKKNLFLRNVFRARLKRISKRTFVFILIYTIIEYAIFTKSFSNLFFFVYSFLYYLGQLVFFGLKFHYVSIRKTNQFSVNHTLIVGTNPTGKYLRNIIENNPLLGFKFIGFVNDDKSCDSEMLGKTDELSHLIDKHQIHIVFVTLSLFDDRFKGKEYLRICNKKGIRIRFIPENMPLYRSNAEMESFGNLTIINPQEIPLDNTNSRLLKRLFDIVFSSIVIVLLLSWLFPIVALLIKLSSKGPVLFIQKRTCLNNRVFNCLKFRSMKVNDQADTKQATDYDSRITTLGMFMRKTSIDELPQFFNVLMGHMSISGPRPHMLKHTAMYSELIDIYQVRHYVKPGITGWAQVNGYRGETDELWKMEKRVEYDIEYIENWNFWWDLKIILLTVTNMKSLIPEAPKNQKFSAFGYDQIWQLRKLSE